MSAVEHNKETLDNFISYIVQQKGATNQTAKCYRNDIERFLETILNTNIEQVAKEDIEKFIGKLSRIYKPNTVGRKISSLRNMFRWLKSIHQIEEIPVGLYSRAAK